MPTKEALTAESTKSAIVSLLDRDAGISGADLVAAHGEDPVAVAGVVDDEPVDRRHRQPPEDDHLETLGDQLAEQDLAQAGASSATLALPVISTEPPRTTPCMATSVPRVMISDGTEVRTVRTPLTRPTTTPTAEGAEDADEDRQAEVARDDRHRHRAGRDHGADRDVDLAGDHQQPHGQRHDPEVGREVDPARRAEEAAEVDAAEDHEEGDDGDEA